MALIKTVQLEPTPNELIFGKKWRREETWSCKHGETIFINESGWICNGSYDPCKCCEMRYCYAGISAVSDKELGISEDFCSRCIEEEETS